MKNIWSVESSGTEISDTTLISWIFLGLEASRVLCRFVMDGDDEMATGLIFVLRERELSCCDTFVLKNQAND